MLRSPTPVVDVMNPKVPASEMLFPGFARLGWFNALSASKRNCRLTDRGNEIVRNRPRSTFQKPGPRTLFRGDVPNRCGWPGGVLTRWRALPSKALYWVGA